MAQQLALFGSGLLLLSIAGTLLIAAIVVLLESAVAALITSGLSLAIASLIVAGPTLLLGLVILWAGARRIRAKKLSPSDTNPE
jgi:hypothetical protein